MRVVRVIACLVLVFAVLPPAPTVAGLRRWTSTGPFGGVSRAIAEHPTRAGVVLAGSIGGGLFRSTDGGRTWRKSSRGMSPVAWVNAVQFSLSNPSIVYATTLGAGLYRSTDGGRQWTRMNPELWDTDQLAVHPRKPRIVFVTNDWATLRSTDSGRTWTNVLNAPFESWVGTSVAIARTRPNVVYATNTAGLMISRDGGDTWSNGGSKVASRVIVHPHDASVVYIGGGDGVSKSTDGGRTFRRIFALPDPDRVNALAFDARDPRTVYAGTVNTGMYRLRRGNVTRWQKGLPRPHIATVTPLRSGTVLAGLIEHAIYRREPGARRWRTSRQGFRNCRVLSLAVPASAQSVVYAGTSDQGVARSADHGKSWRWRGLNRRTVYSLAVHPRDANVVYAATNRGVFRTTNGGRSWTRRLAKPAHDIVISHSAPRRVYAGSITAGVFRSSDHGRTWTKTALSADSEVLSMAVHPTRPGTLYAGTRHLSVVKSRDGGRTWKQLEGTRFGEDPEDIAIDPTRPERVFVSIHDVGILRTLDAGATWRRMAGGSEPKGGNAVVIDPRRPRRVFAAVGDAWWPLDPRPGVYRSGDGGRTWERMNKGLITRQVSSLALGGRGAMLHAGTGGVRGDSGVGVFQWRFR